MTKRKKIALFGGSFNPPHEGHREIVRRIARRKTIDEVWILPVYRHPFGKRLPSFSKRVRACHLFFLRAGGSCRPAALRAALRTVSKGRPAVTRSPKIKIKSYEHRPKATGYTIDLIHYLKKKFPTYRFSWVMGADTYKERKKWKEFPKLKKEVRFIIFPRGPKSPIPNISSTQIRRRFS
ncbi:MAG: nicotinate-nicotinamide nucleotide adenylyltransferase [Deltaproteobacteria bacterium]|nr:nicotinate-nicotinamide nucleotide adenylyltransferase [Deltaproteobacteria bacterium]